MTMTPETLEALVVKISGDLSDLRADLQNAVNMAQQAGQQAGNAFGQGTKQGGQGVDLYFKVIQNAVRDAVSEAKAGIITNEKLTATLRFQEEELRELIGTTQRGTAAYRQYVDELGRVTGELNRLDRAQDSVNANNAQAGQGAAGLGAQFASLRMSIQGAVAAAAAWAGNQAVREMVTLAKEADSAEKAVTAFDRSVKRAGLSSQEARGVVDALADRFGVMNAEAYKAAETLIRNGASLQQVKDAFTAAGASAAREGFSVSQAWDNMATALVTGRSELLESMGVITNLGPVYQKYQKEIGATKRELTDQERITAGLNAIMKETKSEIADVDIYLQGLTRSEQQNAKAKKELRDEIGNALKPAVSALMQEQTRALEGALKWAQANKGELKESINAVAIAVTDAYGAGKVLLGFLKDLGVAAGGVVTVLLGLGASVVGGLKGAFESAFTEIRNLFKLGLESLQTFQQAWEKLKSGDLKGALGLVNDQLQKNWDAARNAPGNIWNGAQQGAAYGRALTGEGINDITSFGSRTSAAVNSANASSNRVRNALDGMVKGQELIDALALVGRRRGAAYGNKYLNGQIHNGEDFFAPTGTALTAPFTGLVTKRWSETTGHIIEMIDAQGNKLLLGHLDKYAAGLEAAIEKAGGKLMVKAGTVLGTVGETGSMANIMGAKNNDHVHIMARRAGQAAGANTSPLNVAFKGFDAENAWNGATGGSGGNSGPAKEAVKSWQEYEKEARRIIGDIKKYAADGTVPNGDKWRLANEALKAFTKDNQMAAAAVQWVQSETKKAAAETSKYGQTFDSLKGKLDVTDSLSKLGQNVVPQLKTIQAEAQKAAAAEKARWGETEKYRQLLGLAADAAAKLNTITSKDGKDAETAAKNRLKTQQDLQAALSKGQEQTAQNLLTNLKAQQAKELDLARDSATKRAQITAQTGPAIIAAEDKLAAIRRDRAVKAAQQAADEAKKLPGADLKAIEATRVEAVRQAYATEKQERDKARADQRNAETQANRTALQAQQQHARERNKLIAQAEKEARQLRYEEADTTLNRVKADNKAELDAFRGTAAEKLALLRKQTQEESEAGEIVARIRKQNRVRELENQYAGKPNDPTFLAAKKLAEQQYADTVTGLKNARVAAIRGAQDDLNKAMQDIVNSPESKAFRDAYTLNLIPGANGFNGAGSGDTTALYKFAEQRDALQGVKDAFAGLGDNAADAASIVEHDLIPQVEAIINKTDDAQLKQAAQDYLKFLKDSRTELLSLAELQDAFNKVRLDAIAAGQSVVAGGEGVLDAFRRQDAQDAMIPGNSTVDVMELLRFDPAAVLDMGDTMGQEFIDGVLNSVNGESLSSLGADTLQGLIDAVGSDPKWANFKKKLEEGLTLARDLAAEIDDLLRRRDAQIGVSGFLPDNTNPADVMTVNADDAAQAFDDLRDSIKGMTDEQLKLMTTDPIFAANTEMKSAALAEMKRRADGVKDALAQMEAAETMNALLAGPAQAAQTLIDGFAEGKVSAEALGEGLQGVIDDLQVLADAGDKAAKRLIAGLNGTIDATKRLQQAEQQAEERRIRERGQDAGARGDFRGQMQASRDLEAYRLKMAQSAFDTEVKTLTEGTPEYKLAQQKLEDARNGAMREGAQERRTILASELAVFQRWVEQAGSIFKKFTDGQDNAFSIATDYMSMNLKATQQAMAGDIPGAIMTTIEGIMNIGEAIASLDPKFRAWKKNLLEIAQLEKEAMGSKKYGNISNPYYDALAQDAGNREKLGNSKWYQRLWWNLTGSTPQVMEDGAAKLMSTAGQVFGDMAQSINSTLESSLMDAFELGDFSKVEESFKKTLNTIVAKMALQAVIAASNLKDTLKVFADDVAKAQEDGVITADEQALLNRNAAAVSSSMSTISSAWQAMAPTLPGYGQNAQVVPPDGSIAAMQEEISKLQSALNIATNQQERDRLQGEIDAKQRQLDAMQGQKTTTPAPALGSLTPNGTVRIEGASISTTANFDLFGTLSQSITQLATVMPTWLTRLDTSGQAHLEAGGRQLAAVDRLERLLTRAETDWGELR